MSAMASCSCAELDAVLTVDCPASSSPLSPLLALLRTPLTAVRALHLRPADPPLTTASWSVAQQSMRVLASAALHTPAFLSHSAWHTPRAWTLLLASSTAAPSPSAPASSSSSSSSSSASSGGGGGGRQSSMFVAGLVSGVIVAGLFNPWSHAVQHRTHLQQLTTRRLSRLPRTPSRRLPSLTVSLSSLFLFWLSPGRRDRSVVRSAAAWCGERCSDSGGATAAALHSVSRPSLSCFLSLSPLLSSAFPSSSCVCACVCVMCVRALYLSVLHERPFLDKENFVQPYKVEAAAPRAPQAAAQPHAACTPHSR